MLSYSYTLEHQGLVSNISCIYDTTSPVAFAPLNDSTVAMQYSGVCDGKVDVLTNVLSFLIPIGNSTLGYWACKSPPNGSEDPSYFIYLRGRSFYGAAIGNITCTVSPIKPAIFPVTYHSGPRIFSLGERTSVSPATYPRSIERTLVALGSIIQTSQNYQSNLVAESVITFGVKSFGLPPYIQNPQYLRLYEAMIQGMLEYQVCSSCELFFFFLSKFLTSFVSKGYILQIVIFDGQRLASFLSSYSERERDLRSDRLAHIG